jgi:hypothetical protein
VQLLGDDLQGEVAASRVTGEDELRQGRAVVEQVLDGGEENVLPLCATIIGKRKDTGVGVYAHRKNKDHPDNPP